SCLGQWKACLAAVASAIAGGPPWIPRNAGWGKPMRLLFTATNLRSEGGVILMRHLLAGFLAHDASLEIGLYLHPELVERCRDWPELSERVVQVAFRTKGGLRRFYWEQVMLPRIIRRRKIDILFSFGNTGPR